MDIESILNSLGLDLTNPEVKRGAIEAIEAILDSRTPDDGAGMSGGASGEQDVEIDPDLLQPSIKNKPQEGSDDIEINDEDEVLKNLKHNDSDDSEESPMSNDSESGNSDNENTGSESSDSRESDSNSEPSEDDLESSSGTESEGESEFESDDGPEKASSSENNLESDVADENELSDTDSAESSEIDPQEDDNDSAESDYADDADDAAKRKDEASDTSEAENDEADDNEVDSTEEESSDEYEADDEVDIDEDDLLDDNLKKTFDDQEQKAKQEARRIKRERTLQAAHKALDDAKAKRKPAALIRELEKAIEALESLQEAATKTLNDMSDEEFNLIVNRVFDAIDALGDSGLTYTSEEERKIKAQEIKADLEDKRTQAELSAEDVAQIRAETQAIKAREKENTKYQKRSRSSFKGFQDFLNSLYRAVAMQVHTEETQDDTWSAINRRYSGTGVLQQGKRINELPNKKIPVIDFYFDQSGSWDESDLRIGEKAVEALVEMEEKGQIKINIYYFANNVHTDAASARAEGGTWAWNQIVKNVITTQATNVIIMTDSDMEDQWDLEVYWSGSNEKAASYTVPGYVWYLWRGGDNSPRLPRDLKGRGGTQQFSFNSGDL